MMIRVVMPESRVASPRRFVPRCRILLLAAVTVGVASNAAAQLVPVSGPRTVNSEEFVFGGDAAYDPVNRVYLVVMAREHGDTLGSVLGQFVDIAGNVVGSPFLIQSAGRANFARAVYSPLVSNGAGGTGGFLVTWTEPFAPYTYSRAVAYPNHLAGPVGVLSLGYSGPPEIAYSTSSQVFVSAWESKDSTASVTFRRVGSDGQPLGVPVVLVSGADAGRSPVLWNSIASVAWHRARDEFGILYAQRAPSWTLRLARVSPAGVVLDTRIVASVEAPPIAAALQFSPPTGNYIALWAEPVAGLISGAEVSGTGTVIAIGTLPSTIIGSQNGMALSDNAASGTFLLLGFTQMSGVEQVKGVELNKHGAPDSGVIDVTSFPLTTNYFAPRAAARPDAAEWLVTAGGPQHYAQIVGTSSAHGGSDLRLDGCYGPDPFAAIGGGTCHNGSWLPPGMTPPSGGATTTPPPSSPGCTTPDPFAVLGGGTCYNGGWLPPGMSPPSGGTAAPPNPPPDNPPPSSPSSGCTTPDPFVVLGGGTCYNGGWLPPGMSPPSGSTAPAPNPPSDNPPPPSPSPSPGCTTPDPFAVLGGGTCYNGGWLPPGMTPPSGGGTTTPPPSSSPGCTTPDPFAVLGGGTCYNGGWLPPGMIVQ